MIFRTVLRALKPFQLISMVMTYLLGAGLVQYVRELKSWSVLIQGGLFLVMIAISLELVCLLQRMLIPKNWPEGMSFKEARLARIAIAMLAATFLTISTSIFIAWMRAGVLWQGLVLLLLGVLLVCGLYFVVNTYPSLKTFVVLSEVLLFVVIPPAVAFFLQANEGHRFLTMVVISLVPGYLANRFLHLLQRFGRDEQFGIETLVTQIGWENAMFFHNALILFAYVLFALIAFLGFHWFIIWPVFLTLPIGLLEIWLMERIRRGMKPLWGVMRFAAACVFFIPVYLLGFAFWIR